MPKPTRAERQAHKRFLKRQQVYERTYRRQFLIWLNSVNKAVANWMVDNNSLSPSIDVLMDGGKLDGIYRRLYNRVTIEEARIAWDSQFPDSGQKDLIDALASLLSSGDEEDGVPINLWRRLLNDYLTVRIVTRIQEVENTSRKRIALLIQKGIEDGLGAEEVARVIRKDTGYNRNRSLAIARTETVTAMNQGKYLAAQSSPYEMEKKWSPTLDGRERPSHGDMYDRPFVSLDQPFFLANAQGALEEAQYPGDSTLSASNTVNCRCSLITRAKVGPNGRPIRKSMKVKGEKSLYYTQLKAIDPADGELKDWVGPRIPAHSLQEAKDFVNNNGMGYLDVDGKFITEKE